MSDERIRIGMVPPNPGSFIRTEVLKELGLSVVGAANILGVRPDALFDLIVGKPCLSPQMAVKIEEAFGASKNTLVRMGAWHGGQSTRQNSL